MPYNKIKFAFILLFVFFVAGCGNRYYVECDSGFKTPNSEMVFISGGNIKWSVNGEFITYRQMLDGEICYVKNAE